MGKINSRAKGARYERELARYFEENGFPARRGQQFAGGSDSPDVVCDEFPFHIEAKFVEALNLYSAMTQSIRDAGDKPPCVIHRKKNSESMFTCRLSDLVALLTKQQWKEE
jgi:hypothetical protein|tara:strand:- start:1151 stop:1483 length:333 start_codon:yes stop_codon:yes gene_type:complete